MCFKLSWALTSSISFLAPRVATRILDEGFQAVEDTVYDSNNGTVYC